MIGPHTVPVVPMLVKPKRGSCSRLEMSLSSATERFEVADTVSELRDWDGIATWSSVLSTLSIKSAELGMNPLKI